MRDVCEELEGAHQDEQEVGRSGAPGGVVVVDSAQRLISIPSSLFLQPSTHDFSLVLNLPPGPHRLKFIVDESWRCSDDLATATDADGSLVNYLEVEPEAKDGDVKTDWGTEWDTQMGGVEPGECCPCVRAASALADVCFVIIQNTSRSGPLRFPQLLSRLKRSRSRTLPTSPPSPRRTASQGRLRSRTRRACRIRRACLGTWRR